MKSAPSGDKLRQWLWEAHVYPHFKRRPQTLEEHEQAALHVIQMYRRASQRTDDARRKRGIAAKAHFLWRLMMVELGAWLMDFGDGFMEETKDAPLRLQLRALLRLQNQGPPTHLAGLDPVALLIPKKLRDALESAMEALDQGEVHDLVKPERTHRHGDGWTWDQMRVRALEHVAFLCGQGLKKLEAQKRVSLAMGMGSIDTLRSWEKRGSPLRETTHGLSEKLEIARQAGRLVVEGYRDDVEADAVVCRLELVGEDLKAFGPRYNGQFGGRTVNRGSTKGGD